MTRTFMKTYLHAPKMLAFAAAFLMAAVVAHPVSAGPLLVDTITIASGDKIIASSKTEQFDRSSIFEYSDGGADVYLDGGFADCFVRQYDFYGNLKGGLEITAYDMTTPLKTQGLFQTLSEGRAISRIGDLETMSDVRRCVFHKAAWLVEIVDKSDKQSAASALLKAAKALSALVPDGPIVPPEYSQLPLKEKTSGSERYYHRNFLSRSYFPCALTAQYICGAAACTLFISRHDSAAFARKDLNKLAASLSARNTGDTLVTPALTVLIKGSVLIGVSGQANQDSVMGLIRACAALLP